MFDIGFAELLIIGVVGLLVIGPERLPGAIRTGSAWINRVKRGLSEVNAELQRELHNDAVLRELRDTKAQLQRDVTESTEAIGAEVADLTSEVNTLTGDKDAEANRDPQ